MPHPLTRWFARALVGSLIVIGVVRVMAATQQAQTPPAQAVGAQGAQAASGVAPAPAPAAAPRPVTPEQKAYNDAVAIKDPTEKLAALQKVQADFPTSVNVMRLADGAILDLYLASWPEKTDDIAKLVDKAVTAIPASATPESRYNTIVPLATKLIDKKVMLDAAAALITPALANLDMAKYVAAQKAAANPNRPAQTDAALETTFKSIRSRGEEQLGRIAFEKGDFATAEKFFKEGLADSATLLRAPIALAEIEVKRGNNKGALEYYKMPAVQGKLKPSEDEAFRALYAKVNGSTAGLEKELDKFYEEKFPNPVKTEKYVPPASATDRMVLIEMFTGSGCPPCVGADLALEGLMARYPNTSDGGSGWRGEVRLLQESTRVTRRPDDRGRWQGLRERKRPRRRTWRLQHLCPHGGQRHRQARQGHDRSACVDRRIQDQSHRDRVEGGGRRQGCPRPVGPGRTATALHRRKRYPLSRPRRARDRRRQERRVCAQRDWRYDRRICLRPDHAAGRRDQDLGGGDGEAPGR
jgi:tetratricopeptide (TPR) repeat protein